MKPINNARIKQAGIYLARAKRQQDIANRNTNKLFEFLEACGLDDLEKFGTDAENSSNLKEAICCYIDYGEYSEEGLLAEIGTALKIMDEQRA